MTDSFCQKKQQKNPKTIFNLLVNPLISRCEKLKTVSDTLHYYFLQSKVILWKVLFVKMLVNH